MQCTLVIAFHHFLSRLKLILDKHDFDIWKRVYVYKKGEELIDKKYFLKAEVKNIEIPEETDSLE